MIYGFEESQRHDDIAALTSEIRVRVLNCGAGGCLLETNAAIAIGTVGVLGVTFGGRAFTDAVRVVRLQAIAGSGGIHHVGVEFLTATPPYADTLRYVMRRDVGHLGGWLRTS